MRPYLFGDEEPKWRDYWERIDLYRTQEQGAPNQKKCYILEYFPYPSGDGLSVGHCRNYVPACVYARYRRRQGDDVLHPMGWDAFGLPAENYAIRHGVHPRETTRRATDNYRRQLKLIECSYDWSREINSSDPAYYRWTQWFFLFLHRRGLAYRAEGEQWWCATCQTILANEQVESGCCWRCHREVGRKTLAQWYFRITEYAERLLSDLNRLDWPESIKAMQRRWIGRTAGVDIRFGIADHGDHLTVFTTRPETLFGATYLAIAPEHPLALRIAGSEQAAAVLGYVESARKKSELQRSSTTGEKSGVWTGAFAIHPATRKPVPIWIADYVLPQVGTGAVMGVPAHDDRDREFAERHGLPSLVVIDAEARLQASGIFSGLPADAAVEPIVRSLEETGEAERRVRYKMRDWLISRQRYWGAPIPIVHCARCGPTPVSADDLPVLLPDVHDFAPAGDGRSPLARARDWVETSCPSCGARGERETDTLDGFACSSWYFLRFTSPHASEVPFDPEQARRWMPVDMYIGGAEHAVMHLLYARFWTKVMFDAGLLPFDEPYPVLRNQGVLLSPIDGHRMSKSRGNVVTPDEVVARYGTDVLRAYVLFLGPFDGNVTWDEAGIQGIVRFLDRYRRQAEQIAATTTPIPRADPPANRNSRASAGGEAKGGEAKGGEAKGGEAKGGEDQPSTRLAEVVGGRHRLIQRVTADFEAFRFHTALSAMMEYLAEIGPLGGASDEGGHQETREAIESLTILLSPICPFITEHVWQNVLGHPDSVHRQPWPAFDPAEAWQPQCVVVFQVDGKLRDRVTVPRGTEAETLEELALSNEVVKRRLLGRQVRRVVVVPDRLVNVVTCR